MVENQLSETTTVHWHGMHLPARNDGGPHQPIAAGEQWQPEWLIDQPAATLWYHPHPHGETEVQVTRGLAGLFYLDDGTNPDLPHRYGIDDIPIIVQDRSFDSRGQFALRGRAVTGLLGDKILVNGTYNPYLPVSTSRLRLRILNASTARIYHVAFADDREFAIIATDAGFLPSAQQTGRLLLSPAERAEIVVDLKPGERPVLRSVPWDLGMMIPLTNGAGGNDHLDLLQLRAEIHWLMVAVFRSGWRPLRPSHLIIWRSAGPSSSTVARSTVSRWKCRESTPWLEPAQPSYGRYATRTISRTTSTSMAWRSRSFRPGSTAPDPQLGWKDTVLLAAGETVQLAIKLPPYEDPMTPYMYHCHLMWHEDVGNDGSVHRGRSRSSGLRAADPGVDHDHMAAGHDHG